ncbi:uncharacterized protein LOC118542814 [Halichoerus grypus]
MNQMLWRDPGRGVCARVCMHVRVSHTHTHTTHYSSQSHALSSPQQAGVYENQPIRTRGTQNPGTEPHTQAPTTHRPTERTQHTAAPNTWPRSQVIRHTASRTPRWAPSVHTRRAHGHHPRAHTNPRAHKPSAPSGTHTGPSRVRSQTHTGAHGLRDTTQPRPTEHTATAAPAASRDARAGGVPVSTPHSRPLPGLLPRTLTGPVLGAWRPPGPSPSPPSAYSSPARRPGHSDTPPDSESPDTAQSGVSGGHTGRSRPSSTRRHARAHRHGSDGFSRPPASRSHTRSPGLTHTPPRVTPARTATQAPPTQCHTRSGRHTRTHPRTSAEAALCKRDRRTDWQTDKAPASQPGGGQALPPPPSPREAAALGVTRLKRASAWGRTTVPK